MSRQRTGRRRAFSRRQHELGERPSTAAPRCPVAVGELVAFLGETHRVVALEAAEHPELGPYWIARCERGWTISVYPGDRLEVVG